MKERVSKLSALPTKRVFFSIIVDYNLENAICELVDNVVDVGISKGRKTPVTVKLDLDTVRQTMQISDDAGGIAEEDLSVIVTPGETLNTPTVPTIGIFGVGSKRAVVALAEDVAIRTRRTGCKDTFQVGFDKSWIDDSNDWELDYYRVDPITEGTTQIDLSRLRLSLSPESIATLTSHLGKTYAQFLKSGSLKIKIGQNWVQPFEFNDWSFPPEYPPRDYTGTFTTPEGDTVDVRLRAGLMRHSSPVGEYGVYLYFNDRFIIGALKDQSVGFMTGLLGQMHPDLSLLRAELWLTGPARAMPWNSTKSGLHQDHKVYVALRSWLIQTLKGWASLSRRLQGEWQEKITPFATGSFVPTPVGDLPAVGKSYLPDLPPSRPRVAENLRRANKEIADEKPWTTGLYESMAAVDIILKRGFDQRNRIALLIIDSTLEIAFKEYLVNEVGGERYGDDRLKKLFENRISVHDEIKKHVDWPEKVWRRISYFYDLRRKMIHERATVSISDSNIENFRAVAQDVLKRLFNLQFEE